MASEPWFLHVDLDAFFASVEQLDHPEYRGKPLIVGGLPTDPRSVVSTASYEARKFGVHSAMPTAKAYKLCPQGIYVHGNMKRYEEMSYQIMNIFKRYSPDVMQMSIDEAFIDLTGTERLFGPPEQTAMEIKRVVKEETGLTVSIGLSRSKYFAKVSSGLNKPDGFYFMQPGTESDFMLRTPIDKIWGIGNKTAKRIFDSGIKTTQQLYEKSLDVLTFMYGDSTGTFLYNILRGNADGMFDGEVKSHSISNERTFPFDVTDVYTNETALLELAHSVMFRLLRDNLSSKTIVIKIRYEDFTTVSIRQTYSNDILTLDSFYEKVKDLFEKKYEFGRGVRLLGVGFDNVKNEASTYQQDLFDDGEKKKQAVEQAILKIEKKFPDIHVQKARTVKSSTKPKLVLAFALILGLLIKSPNAFSKEKKSNSKTSDGAGTLLVDTPFLAPLPGESPETLFDINIKDSNVEFIASGYWNIEFTGGVIMAFNGGYPFSVSFGVPIFKQDVNLSTWLMVNKKWYMETLFTDEFKKNTLAFGYKGDGIIKSALLSNRNIIYPAYYSSNIFNYNPGGGENQAPGFGMHIEKEKLFADFMIRYDMQKSRDATFYGTNAVTDTKIKMNDYINGRFFIIPSGFVSKIKNVYVENSRGTFRDKSGRKYKKLSSSQYFILPNKSSLILSKDAQSEKTADTLPSVLVSFTNDNDTDSLIGSIGTYNNEDTFLGKIQKYFNTAKGQNIELSDYAYGKTNDSLKTEIENDTALIIQSPLGFSPFINASNYDLGFESDADLYVYSNSNDKPNPNYLIEQTRDTLLLSDSDFFNDKHNYGTVFIKEVSTTQSTDYENDVSLRFPVANTNPMIYLNNSYESNLSILLRLYSRSSTIQIDSGVSAGCVRVYKNGVLDSGAKYDSSTGFITLSSSVSDTDKIYVTWVTESDDIVNGKITADIGVGYAFTPNLLGDLDITTSIPITPLTKYADINDTKNGFAALTTGIRYDKNNFKISDAISISLEAENLTGAILVLESPPNIPETFYLSSSDGYKTLSVPILNTKRYSSEPELKIGNKTNPGNPNGKIDSEISGYKIPLEINFKSIPETEAAWTSTDIKLSNGNILLNCDTFNIAIKKENVPSNCEVFLQLGNFATEDEIKISEDLLPTWKLTEKSSSVPKQLSLDDSTDGTWQIVSVKISETDRARFFSYHDARIIVVSKPGTDRNKNGLIYIGPYEIEPIAFETFASKGIEVKSSSRLDKTSPTAKKFSKQYNYVNKTEWKSDTKITESNVRLGSFFPKTDYSHYEKIRFDYKMYYKIPQNSGNSGKSNTFSIILDSGSTSILENGVPSVKVVINGDFVTQNDNLFHSFEIDVQKQCVYIDGTKIPHKELYINRAVVPSSMKIDFDGFDNGDFDFDTLYFDGSSPYLKGQNYFAASYKKDDVFASVKETAVLSDFSVNFNSLQSGSIDTVTNNENRITGFVEGFVESGITLTTIRLQADASLSSRNYNSTHNIVDNAGHSISTISPILNLISLTENYRFNTVENSTDKKDSVKIDISNYSFPLSISGNANSKSSNISNSQELSGNILFSSKYLIFDAATIFNQKVNIIKSPESKNNAENYFKSYASSTVNQFSGGEKSASTRAHEFQLSLQGLIPVAKLSPKISYKINGEYKSLSESTHTDNQNFAFIVPFGFEKHSINLSWKKQSEKINSVFAGGNYKSDLRKTFSDINETSWFYKSIPFYDLFDKNLRAELKNDWAHPNTQVVNYTTNYGVYWNRNYYNSIKDFFIPTSVGFEVERDIKSTETLSDLHQYKFNVNNSFINLFGANSKNKIFKWYNQDEFTSSIECKIKVPYDDTSKLSYTMSVYEQLIFFINNSSNLKTAADFSIETTGDWSVRGTAIYSYGGKKAPLLSFFNLFYKGEDLNEKITRKDIFNMELASRNLELSQKYELSHNCEIKFLKNYSLSTGIKTAYTHNNKKSDTLGIDITLGGRMEF